ncbi:DUF4326 domain-containing protein [Amycolatopsis sp. K13G38]|uniref:DUF4326 domain-containing protein n=1 Tax=Amycolatopsis acididurans TaxID=2724524 RepID=A0ABX1JFV1_9PSEU|nr:DUF4326 domain-containing protein [Amycolatopsis acididurans]NKQ57127.1 DUF4326 domain-containing protein [Amycolatopsis acididurans]
MAREVARIQRERTRGWRMPAGAVYVGRPTRWGSPFHIGREFGDLRCPECGFVEPNVRVDSPQRAVELFDAWLRWPRQSFPGIASAPTHGEVRDALAGHDLACWCPADQPCHADILLALANPGSVFGGDIA